MNEQDKYKGRKNLMKTMAAVVLVGMSRRLQDGFVTQWKAADVWSTPTLAKQDHSGRINQYVDYSDVANGGLIWSSTMDYAIT